MSGTDFEKVDWGLVDRYFDKYGVRGTPGLLSMQAEAFVRDMTKEGLQLVFYGVVLGLCISLLAAAIFQAISALGEMWIWVFNGVIGIVAVLSCYLFFTKMVSLRWKERNADLEPDKDAHEYFIELIREGFDQNKLWYELSRRKYYK